MKLYYNPISSYSQKVLIAFNEKGLEFEPNIVNLMDPDGRAKYREVYPLGKVPCLVVDGDHLIPESSIIIEYIDSLAGPRLIEGDAEATRKIRFKDRMFDLYLNDSVVTLLFQGMKPEEQRDAERIETAQFRIDTMYNFMEHEFGQQSFANGEKFTMADCAAAPALFYAEQAAPFSDHKNISAYWERLKERPSIQRTHEEARPVLEAFMSRDAA
ncbi:MAG: glutathione S-transferase family protein [Woeseia sp.]